MFLAMMLSFSRTTEEPLRLAAPAVLQAWLKRFTRQCTERERER
jgi:hypothetical protein